MSADDGSWHEVACLRHGLGYGSGIAWKLTRLPRKIPGIFLSQPFFCGFCAPKSVESLKLEDKGVATFIQLKEVDCLDQYGRCASIRICRVLEEEVKDPNSETTKIVLKVGISES